MILFIFCIFFLLQKKVLRLIFVVLESNRGEIGRVKRNRTEGGKKWLWLELVGCYGATWNMLTTHVVCQGFDLNLFLLDFLKRSQK